MPVVFNRAKLSNYFPWGSQRKDGIVLFTFKKNLRVYPYTPPSSLLGAALPGDCLLAEAKPGRTL